jgi:hypothetical protein
MHDPYRHVPDREAATPALLARREAILRVSHLLGGVALVGGSALWTAGCTPAEQAPAADGAPASRFTADQVALLDEIAETILPATGTPGAKAAGVGPFMALMVTDCYEPADQAHVLSGLTELEARCTTAHGHGFLQATPAERLAIVEAADREAHAFHKAKKPDERAHWFRMMKELALLGYFTSEIGYTQAMRYVETPGRYDPCVPLEPGGKIWADHA